MKRIGTVLVFKEDVTAEEAAAALEKIQEVVDTSYHVATELKDTIETFNDDHGGPVWFVP